jgi:hypothetical protein
MLKNEIQLPKTWEIPAIKKHITKSAWLTHAKPYINRQFIDNNYTRTTFLNNNYLDDVVLAELFINKQQDSFKEGASIMKEKKQKLPTSVYVIFVVTIITNIAVSFVLLNYF